MFIEMGSWETSQEGMGTDASVVHWEAGQILG